MGALFTGYHLLSLMYGDVAYVPRSEYSLRDAMLQRHAARIRSQAAPDAKVIVHSCLNRELMDCTAEPPHPCNLLHKLLASYIA